MNGGSGSDVTAPAVNGSDGRSGLLGLGGGGLGGLLGLGSGGLGDLISTGLQSNFKAQVLTASVLCVVIALVLDLLLLGVQWVLMPWRRAEAA